MHVEVVQLKLIGNPEMQLQLIPKRQQLIAMILLALLYERQGRLHPITRTSAAPTIREERSAPLLLILCQQRLTRESTKMMGAVMCDGSRHCPPCVAERPILELIRTAVSPYYYIFTLSIMWGNGEGVMTDE